MRHRLTHYTEPWHIKAQGEENKRQAQLKFSVSNPPKLPEIPDFQLEAWHQPRSSGGQVLPAVWKQGWLKCFKWVRLSHWSPGECRPPHFHLHSSSSAHLSQSLGHKPLKQTLSVQAGLEQSESVVGISVIKPAALEQILICCYNIAGPRLASAQGSSPFKKYMISH